MKNNDNEVFSVEELNNLNEKLKENENISLPQSLSTQEIENKLKKQTQFIPLRTERKKFNKKRLQRIVAMAASLVIVFTSLMITKPWEEKSKPVAPTNNNTQTEDYSEIENMFADYAEKYKKASTKNGAYNLYDNLLDGISSDKSAADEGVAENMNSGSVTIATSTGKGGNFGKTNEQVNGVNEADIIKNDGKYIYYVANSYVNYNEASNIHIASVNEDGKLKKITKIGINIRDIKDLFNFNISEIYLNNNKLIVISNYSTSDRKDYYANQFTHATCYDISDIKKPVELWNISQDGSYISSRLIDDNLIILSRHFVNLSNSKEVIKEKCIPSYSVNGKEKQRVSCDCIHIMEELYDSCYLVASAMNINNEESYETTAVLGGGSNVYCTTNSLYVTSTRYTSNSISNEVFNIPDDVKTEIFKFNINNGKIEYACKNAVKGNALNQFSIDEYKGYLRIATTTGTWGSSLRNHLFILDNKLEPVGKVSDFAKGETIKSVRFTGDTGYVVTFEQTDPLFVIDLSDPAKPEIVGELKIPGFSTYLHPVDDGLVLGVGEDGNESGTNGGLKLSLFDVSDPQKPTEADKITVNLPEGHYAWLQSEAYYTHKAVCWDSENKTMYVPYTINANLYTGDNAHPYRAYNSANILAVKINTEESKLESDITYTSNKASSGFQRVTYIDDFIIGFSYESGILQSFNKTTAESIDIV